MCNAIPAYAISGKAYVHDGDTISISYQKIRLHGIDAPEMGQMCYRHRKKYDCGKEAKWALFHKIKNKNVRCRIVDTDRYRRKVGVCFIGSLNINEWLVEQGHALAYRRYSTDYVPNEINARKARRGVHVGKHLKPWEVRR